MKTFADCSQRHAILAAFIGVLLLAEPGAVVRAESCGAITTIAGRGMDDTSATPGEDPLGDGGPATKARFHIPHGVAVDHRGDVYVADTYHYRIRRVHLHTGIIRTIAGTGEAGFSGDGGPAVEARIDRPYSMAFDRNDNLYFTDTGNNRIRRVDAETGFISTVVGVGNARFSGDGGSAAAASLGPAYGLTIGPAGGLYVADTGNDRIRVVDGVTGRISTVAGNGAALFFFAGDGEPATQASLKIPYSVALDPAGDIFIADTGNGRIRRVERETGRISTVAGIGPIEAHHIGNATSSIPVPVPGSGVLFGDGGPGRKAVLSKLRTIVSDQEGNMYVADSSASRIWRWDADTGTITSIAGTGSDGFSGDRAPAYKASIWDPMGLAFDAAGNLYIADSGNDRIRRVSPPFCSDEFPPVPASPPAPA